MSTELDIQEIAKQLLNDIQHAQLEHELVTKGMLKGVSEFYGRIQAAARKLENGVQSGVQKEADPGAEAAGSETAGS